MFNFDFNHVYYYYYLPTTHRPRCDTGGNSDGKLYLNRLLNEGKVTAIAEIKPEDFKVPSWYDKKKYQRYALH